MQKRNVRRLKERKAVKNEAKVKRRKKNDFQQMSMCTFDTFPTSTIIFALDWKCENINTLSDGKLSDWLIKFLQ